MADNYCKCCGDGTPEYIIELNQQGAPGKRGEKGEQGYSPVVDFIANNDEIRFTSTNEDNITSTPNLYDFVLKKDGSNATNAFSLNKIGFITNNNAAQRIYTLSDTGLRISGKPLILDGEAFGSSAYPNRIIISEFGNDITLGNTNKTNIIINNDMATYNGNELATVNNISDSKITISQGDVVKGSFTLNQSGDSVIELDSGLTNPLKIEGATVENPSGGTITYGMELGLDSSNKVYLDYITSYYTSTGERDYSISQNLIKDNRIAMSLYKNANIYDGDVNRRLDIGYDTDSKLHIRNYLIDSSNTYKSIAPITSDITNYPIYLEEVSGTPGLEGAYTIKLNYDNNTLKLNESNQLYTDFTEVNNSITELTTLADNTEASLNELKTNYEANKTEVAEELTTLGNQINTKASKTELNELADTKNDNIFDIGKFTIVGSPTITDDGVASGFSKNNYLYTPTINFATANSWEIIVPVKFNSVGIDQVLIDKNPVTSMMRFVLAGRTNHLQLYLQDSSGQYIINGDAKPSTHTFTANANYLFKIKFTGSKYEVLASTNGEDWVTEISVDSTKKTADGLLKLGIRVVNDMPLLGSVDLKQFSITVDGKEVYNGLMNSTKPIYDKITTTNTTLSTFQTNTTNNFSAVNSALNEKANISDLANYVPLATYNALLARVEALEAEINGGNA